MPIIKIKDTMAAGPEQPVLTPEEVLEQLRTLRARIPEFVQRHLIEGQPIEEWIFARNELHEVPRQEPEA